MTTYCKRNSPKITGGTSNVNMTKDIGRCRLCGLTLPKEYRFGEMNLALYDPTVTTPLEDDMPYRTVSTHDGIRICENCHQKLLLEAGILT